MQTSVRLDNTINELEWNIIKLKGAADDPPGQNYHHIALST